MVAMIMIMALMVASLVAHGCVLSRVVASLALMVASLALMVACLVAHGCVLGGVVAFLPDMVRHRPVEIRSATSLESMKEKTSHSHGRETFPAPSCFKRHPVLGVHRIP